MNLTAKVIRTDFRRGIGPLASVAVLGTSLALLFIDFRFMTPWPWAWVGRWGALANSTRVILAILIPIAATAAAWHGGRDHRRRIDELLGSTSRPSWQRTLASWNSVAVATLGALLLAFVICLVFVIPHATVNGGWLPTFAVGLLSLVSATAIGYAVGRLVRFRYMAPVVGIVFLVLMESLGGPGMPDTWGWMSPAAFHWSSDLKFQHHEASLLVQQTFLYAGTGLAALILVGARRKWLAVMPAALAIAGMVLILTGEGEERFTTNEEARALVCAGTGPEVCLTRVDSFVLDDLVPIVEQTAQRWDGIEGVAIARFVDGRSQSADGRPPDTPGTFWLYLQEENFGWNGGLINPRPPAPNLETQLAASILRPSDACEELGEIVHEDGYMTWTDPTDGLRMVAMGWALDDTGYGSLAYDPETGRHLDPTPNPLTVRLLSKPVADQKIWMNRYMEAMPTCDQDVFAELRDELQ